MPTVEANGVELYYERRGEGPPVVFLHGAGADHRVWAAVAEPLTDDYEVITLDLRLHGRSGGDPNDAPTIDTFVDDLRALIDALDLDRPALVGLSLGGMITQRHVARFPDDVAALVTLGAITPEIQSREEWLIRHLVFPIADRLRTHLGPSYEHRFMQTAMRLRRDDTEPSDMEERARIEEAHAADYPEQTDAEEGAVREALDAYSDLAIEYGDITTPFLFMYGEHETSTVAAHADYVATVVPTATVSSIPDASHHSHVDNPAFVVDALREFFDGHLHQTAATTDGG